MTEGLELEQLSVTYGHARALYQASLKAPAGKVTALVGPNGADVNRLSAMARAKAGITLVPQGRQVFPTLTVRENLVIICRLLDLSFDHIESAFDRFPILRTRSKQLAGVLSGGEQQMLAVARALMGSPSVVLLDEMTTGLAPLVVERLMETARELAGAGVAVLMAEPSIAAIRDGIDRGYVLLRGEVVAESSGGAALEAAYQEAMGMALVET